MKKVVIVGGGPAGLFCAYQLLKTSKLEVHLYEGGSGVGKKFLVAGKSGLNLTHSMEVEQFSSNYFEYEEEFKNWFSNFDNASLIEWCKIELGMETFVGSSGRVFPKEFKAAQMLKVWVDNLKSNPNFTLHLNKKLTDFDEAKDFAYFGEEKVDYNYLVLALGGASWSKLGSDGRWTNLFEKKEISTAPFKALNCGFNVNWSSGFMIGDQTLPLKYIEASFDDQKIRGDLMLTSYGLEGTPVYFLSHFIQRSKTKPLILSLDLKPDLTRESIFEKLSKGKKSIGAKLKTFLSENAISLLKEVTTKEEYQDPNKLAGLIKSCSIVLDSARPIDEAISTSGGVLMKEVDLETLAFKKMPNIYAMGEMLDWDAPTGGFLLQGCFSQAFIVSQSIKKATK